MTVLQPNPDQLGTFELLYDELNCAEFVEKERKRHAKRTQSTWK